MDPTFAVMNREKGKKKNVKKSPTTKVLQSFADTGVYYCSTEEMTISTDGGNFVVTAGTCRFVPATSASFVLWRGGDLSEMRALAWFSQQRYPLRRRDAPLPGSVALGSLCRSCVAACVSKLLADDS